jgi:hypothetical protein
VGKSCKIVGGIIKLSTPKFTSVGCHMHVTGTVLFQYEQKLIIISMKTHQSLPPFKLNVPFRSGRFGSGPGPTLRSRSNSGWPWPFLLGSGPPIFDPDTRTFGVGPGRPPGQGPPTLTMDSLDEVLGKWMTKESTYVEWTAMALHRWYASVCI